MYELVELGECEGSALEKGSISKLQRTSKMYLPLPTWCGSSVDTAGVWLEARKELEQEGEMKWYMQNGYSSVAGSSAAFLLDFPDLWQR